MTMIVINIHEAKAKLSEYLDAVASGERVIICNRNRPVAELRAVEQQRTAPRPLGGVEGIVITKHGKPVAKLIPIGTESASLIGALKGRLTIKGDILTTGTKWNAES